MFEEWYKSFVELLCTDGDGGVIAGCGSRILCFSDDLTMIRDVYELFSSLRDVVWWEVCAEFLLSSVDEVVGMLFV